MKKNLKLAGLGLAVVTVGALGVGSAIASPTTSAPGMMHSTTDGDNVQQGDQTTPDVPGAPAEAPKQVAVAPESASSESSAPSDGPGGNADQGNADHQFEGTE